jgi:hypothetical protein
MSPRERLSRYFELVRKGSAKNTEECHEMWHLEEALVDDILELERLMKKHD